MCHDIELLPTNQTLLILIPITKASRLPNFCGQPEIQETRQKLLINAAFLHRLLNHSSLLCLACNTSLQDGSLKTNYMFLFFFNPSDKCMTSQLIIPLSLWVLKPTELDMGMK